MTRRELVRTLAAASGAGLWSPAAAQRNRRYDLMVQGGEVLDPGRGFRQAADVAVLDGRIAAIEPSIPSERAVEVIPAKGLLVTPGLVDLHTHIHYGLKLGIEADSLAARSGVTTWVDAGTFAYTEMEGFRKFIARPAQARIYGFVYLYPSNRDPSQDPVKYCRSVLKPTGEAAVANRDIVLGVKLQVGSNMNGPHSLAFLQIARELCDQYRLPLMAHISFAPPTTDEVMELMRPGDVVTHCYNAHTLGILDGDGRIKPSVLAARRRGVLFDVGHGSGSFNFEVARKALDQGFLPDTISTDVYEANVDGPVFDMPTTLTKMLSLGMSLEDVLVRATANPAKIVDRLPQMGSLEVGGPADIALLELADAEVNLIDSQRNAVTVQQALRSRLTICRGKRLIAPV
ncbi:MAG: amidohydrolase/deacetylase family metallohydrolase [Acidobacteria bacterium]|nr:amidohydrolase/deacetylase family metallohydrolase [Acidobacteriota bacterium]